MSRKLAITIALVSSLTAASLAAPALAAGRHVTSGHTTADAYDSAKPAQHFCLPGPRVGAYATAPWTETPTCEPGRAY
jgi:hypothetical protein